MYITSKCNITSRNKREQNYEFEVGLCNNFIGSVHFLVIVNVIQFHHYQAKHG